MSGQSIPETRPVDPAACVQLYFGQATETGCRVHATWNPESHASEPEAFLHGPESAFATTLRARYPFVRRPGANAGLAEAWIAEPCFWTPAAPYTYRYEIHFPSPAAAVTGMLGIRRLLVAGDHLVFDRKHWVLRGAEVAAAGDEFSIPEWHAAPLAAVIDHPSDTVCEAASRLGVLLVARIGGDVAGELRRLARWPAVGIAILTVPPIDNDPRHHARNILLAQPVQHSAAIQPAAWAQLLLCEVGEPAAFARRVAGCQMPIVATRPAGQRQPPAAARAACDRLQRDLAAVGLQIAGYVV